jgi:hypothetical protein
MGGFKLIGERYVIYSTAPVVCFCMGYIGHIDKLTEEKLLGKAVHVLDPYTDLPVPQRGKFLSNHLPADMSYDVRPREIDDVIREPEAAPLDISGDDEGWSKQFAQFQTVQ